MRNFTPTLLKSFAAALLVTCLASPAFAVDVSGSAEANTTPEKLWAAIGDFCGIANWHPAIAKCELSESNGSKFRKLTTKDGAVLLEKLVKLDAKAMSYTYQITESPLPVANYESTISVAASAKGATVSWKGRFDAKGASDADAQKALQGIYDLGLASLAKTK